MNRTEALEHWKRVAAGQLEQRGSEPVDPGELHAWIRKVAQRVVDADAVQDAVRPGTMLEAVGLIGRHDRSAELRRMITMLNELEVLNKHGKPINGRDRTRALITTARLFGLVDPLLTDDEVRKRIARLLQR